ncbi:hypothetical protein GUJ93_ZPchr0006g43956 [Zizania palustris]|uniref:Dynein light chain n=1 Tax=Zizania palustris TaxID=103762 RepID=A0A8J5SQY3_ZIZPA|nr:hypothetical protein GUJ93_ZPchr0006g43956 [Zizania palustris]
MDFPSYYTGLSDYDLKFGHFLHRATELGSASDGATTAPSCTQPRRTQPASHGHCPPPLPLPLNTTATNDVSANMDPASEELEQRSRYLSSLIRRTKLQAAPSLAPSPPTPPPEPETKLEVVVRREPEQGMEEATKAVVEKREVKEGVGQRKGKEKGKEEERKVAVRVRAADMPLELQRRAVRLAHDAIVAMPRLDNKRLALELKKEFDTSYGPAWHCIVGTGFGSYVTHSLGGFLYFSVDKVYILLFRTAVEPLDHPQ